MNLNKVLAVVLVCAIGVAVVPAYAAVVGSDGVVHACVVTSSKVIKAGDSTKACAKGSTPLVWAQKGPQGVPGPAAGVQYVMATPQHFTGPMTNEPYLYTVDTARCPDGWSATAAGARTSLLSNGIYVDSQLVLQSLYPYIETGGHVDHWQLNYTNLHRDPNDQATITAWVVCQHVS